MIKLRIFIQIQIFINKIIKMELNKHLLHFSNIIMHILSIL